MKTKMNLLFSVMLIAAFVLSACSTSTPTPTEAVAAPTTEAVTTEAPTTAAPTAAPEVKEVTFWHAYGTGSAEETALTALLDQAAADLPGIKINVLQVPFDQIYNKYRTDVAAGGGPDMFIAPNDSLGDDARAGLIADITDLAAGKLGDYSKAAIDGMTVDGKLYGIPESLKAVEFWYNKDMIKEAPKTTDDLKKLMESGTPVAISSSCYHVWGFYSAFGGKVFDDKFQFVTDQGTGMVDAMTYLNELYQIAKKNSWPTTDTDALAPFTEGKVAAVTNGNWAMGDYKKALGDKLAVAPLPAGPAGKATPLLGVDGFMFNPNSQNQEAALEVALYLTNKASQTKMMTDAGHIPANTTVEVTDPLLKSFLDAVNTGVTVRPQDPQLAKYWANFCGNDQVFEKGVSPADWIKSATEAAKK